MGSRTSDTTRHGASFVGLRSSRLCASHTRAGRPDQWYWRSSSCKKSGSRSCTWNTGPKPAVRTATATAVEPDFAMANTTIGAPLGRCLLMRCRCLATQYADRELSSIPIVEILRSRAEAAVAHVRVHDFVGIAELHDP